MKTSSKLLDGMKVLHQNNINNNTIYTDCKTAINDLYIGI